MRAGDLKERITIQDKTVTRNDFGEEIITWTTFATRWAAVEPLRGQEFIEGRQLVAQVSTRFRVRYLDGVKPEMRVSYRDRVFAIIGVVHPFENQRELHLMCEEQVD
jgi:SPP1 family predicted phage head-tail adaptor